MDRMAPHLHRDAAHIKDDMRRTAERLWGLDGANRERLDPLVDLLLGAFAQEIFTLQQEVAEHRRRTLEIAVQAMLPEELASPRPAHAVMQGKPVDPGTWTHRVRTSFSASQNMDVHDRVGTSFSFTPVDEFRLYNGAVRYLAYADKFNAIDARTGQRRTIGAADGKPLAAGEFWIGLELNETTDPSIGLPLFFSLPTDDPETATLIPQLASCSFHLADEPLACTMGSPIRQREALTLDVITNPVRSLEQDARAYYRPQFITLRSLGKQDTFKITSPPPFSFAQVFGRELLGMLDGRVQWLRMSVPSAMDSKALGRLQCAMNCFPVLNRMRYERTATNSRLVPLPHASELQFWAVDEVIDGQGKPVAHERTAHMSTDKAVVPSYAMRKGGMERMDEREAFERLSDLLQTVRNDHAAFAALDETELAKGLNHVRAWLEQYKARQTSPGHPPAYLLLNNMDHRNAHIDYWATNGSAAARIPALKPFRLDRGVYLGECRLITAPTGATDTPERGMLRDRLRIMLGSRSNGLPTVFMVRAICINALPGHLREKVELSVVRDVSVGEGADLGFRRNLLVTLSAETTTTLPAIKWRGHCDHLSTLLNEQFRDLLPVHVRFQEK